MRRTALTICIALTVAGLQAATAFGATIWAVGDGGDWNPNDDALAAMIQKRGSFDRFLYLGDIYETGTPQEWANYYHPSFGRFKSITSPTPGNHDFPNAIGGYDGYFGAQAPQNGGHWYSLDVGGWHLVSLNSEEDTSATSPQVKWLHDDLAKYPGTCTIAFWHRPRYSAAPAGGDWRLDPLWDELEGHGVAILNGHHHDYQRLISSPDRGITEFVVGTGGHFFHTVNASDTRLRAYEDAKYGALRMNLGWGQMDFKFITLDGATEDSGSIPCTPHTSAPPNGAPTAAFNYSPSSPRSGERVSFSSTSSDADGALVSQLWDFDNDGSFDDGAGATPSYTFSTSGSQVVGLLVTDNGGLTSIASRTITVGNQAPTASFTWSPAYPVRYKPVTFTSTSSDPDGTIVSTVWDLDDDNKYDDGSGPTASWTYNRDGTRRVRVKVTDNGGATKTYSRDVRIYKTAPSNAKTVAALPFSGPALPGAPRLRIASPQPLRTYRRQPGVLRGSERRTAEPVHLTLLRRTGKRCRAFTGRRFVRSSCRRASVSFAAGGTGTWAYHLPLDLPRGLYTFTARVRSANGLMAAQSVRFRMAAPVKVRKAPPLPGAEEEAEEAYEPNRRGD